MPLTTRADPKIAYERFGKTGAPPVIFVMGLGGQLTMWPDIMIEAVVEAGYEAILFDNRDIGLSEKMAGAKAPNVLFQTLKLRFGMKTKAPYTLHDMARDTVALMDELEIEKAHFIGVSMGGMISQLVAANHQQRVSSLTAIMTTTGNPKLPGPSRDVIRSIIRRGPPPKTRDEAIDAGVRTFSVIGTPTEDHQTNGTREKIARSYDRSYYPPGTIRQLAAILATGDFRGYLDRISAPTLVLHGTEDPLVSVQGGHDIARLVKDARLSLIEGMGHDLAPPFLDRMNREIIAHLAAAKV